ncbi:hypothetical protein ACFLYU_02930, partial [Candidatus Dependentiae bacterium]
MKVARITKLSLFLLSILYFMQVGCSVDNLRVNNPQTNSQVNSRESFLQANNLQANNLYGKEKYKEALDLYKSIGKKGPVTFYNMGN